MVSTKVIMIMIIISILLLGMSLMINISTPDEIDIEDEMPQGNPLGSIGLTINQPAIINENG